MEGERGRERERKWKGYERNKIRGDNVKEGERGKEKVKARSIDRRINRFREGVGEKVKEGQKKV